MLFHALRGEPELGVDIQQISMTLQEPLDQSLFVYAWYRVTERHAALRARLNWEGREAPVLEVLSRVDLPVTRVDWRGQEPADIRAGLLAQAEAERAMGFDLSQAPLMRLFMARVADAAWSVLWTFHHVILDGRSFAVVLRELFLTYDGLRTRQAPALPEVPPEAALWAAQAGINAESQDFWREHLRGWRGPAPLLTETTPKAGLAREGPIFGARQQRLDIDLSRQLVARAQRSGVGLSTLLHAAWAVLLQRHSGVQDIVVGSTRSGRHALGEAAARAVGLFINTVPLRLQVHPQQRVDDWLAVIRRAQVQQRPHEGLSLAQIQACSEVPRGQPLFESLLVYDHASLEQRLRSGGEAFEVRHFDHVGLTGYPLTLVAYGDDRLLLRVEFDRRRFTDAAAGRLCSQLVTLLQGLADDVAEQVQELPWLTEQERSLLIGPPPQAFDAGLPLHLRFEQQVRRAPQAPAVTDLHADGRRHELSYRQLNERANRVAHRLREQGIQANERVGLRLRRGADLVVGLLAILKAGGAYLPLDPVYPAERVSFMLQDAQVRVLLTERALHDEVDTPGVQRVCMDDAEITRSLDITNPKPLNRPEDLAYVIYTSGSTGQPKGVCITHHHVGRLFAATQDWFGFDERDVWTLFHSYAFDFSVWELWGALLHGGRLITVSQELSRNTEAFSELLVSERVTVLNQTPTAFRGLIDVACQGEPQAYSLRHVIFGGEALELQMLRPWFERYGDRRPRLINMYGITETTVHVTYRPLSREDLDEASGSVIGQAIPDLRLLLLDARGEPVPVGLPGELVVAGAGVSQGYLNRPELTAQRFVPDPYASDPQARMYRSGDLARRLDDGDLEYLGRMDQQVKIRGFRIELGEIEAQILRQGRARQCVVIAREDVPGDKRLVAYLVTQANASDDAAPERDAWLVELRGQLRVNLPDYMVPAHFVFIDSLPLTPNGKLDPRALPAPQEQRPTPSNSSPAEMTPLQAQLAGIWSAVLRVGQVGLHDHFFELGGDSILSIQIIARARQAGLRFTLKDLFEHPTVASLAAHLAPAQDAPQPDLEAGVVLAAHQQGRQPSQAPPALQGPALLTPIQHWFLDQRFAQSHHWNQAFCFELIEPVAPADLNNAWRALLQRHEALHQRFQRDDQGQWQVQLAAIQSLPPLLCIDGADWDEQQTLAFIEERGTEAQAGLDFELGRVARALHFQLAPGLGSRLLIVIHHLVVDGVSWRVLREDLEALIDAERAQTRPVLASLGTSMAVWSRALVLEAAHPSVQQALPYWQSVAQRPSWSFDDWSMDAAEPAPGPGYAPAAWVLPADKTQALLQRVPGRFGTQINAALLSVLLRALRRCARRDSFRIDLEGHGRETLQASADAALDVTRTVGWFTSLFPLALDFPLNADAQADAQADARADARAALRSVHQQWLAVPHRGLSFGLLRWLSPDPAVRSSLAQLAPAPLLFNYLGQFDAVVADSRLFRFAQEATGPWRSPQAHRSHALEVVAQVRNGCLEVSWHADALRVGAAQVMALREALAACMDDLLQALDAPRDAAEQAHTLMPTAPPTPSAPTPQPVPAPEVERISDNARRVMATPLQADAEAAADASAYALTPMQRLFFAMNDVRPELGLEAWHFELQGPLNPTRLQRALMRVVERHAVLRSRFFSGPDGQAQQQVVGVDALQHMPWREDDWRGLAGAHQDQRLQALLADEARTPMDLQRPPLMRVRLLRVADERWHFLWTTHHLTLDGWSWPLVLGEVSRTYAALEDGLAPAEAPALPFRCYVEHVQQEAPESLAFWQRTLAQVTEPTPIARPLPPSVPVGTALPIELHSQLSAEMSQGLQALARRLRITPGCLLQCAWALALAHASASSTVVLGASFSGRPAELPGIDTLVGPCVNNLPVCVTIDSGAAVEAWLAAQQAQQRELALHQTLSLQDIQQQSQVPWRHRLFDSLVVFQNYRIDEDAQRIGRQVSCRLRTAPEASNYALTLAVRAGSEWRLRWMAQGSSLTLADVEAYADELHQVLSLLVERTVPSVGALVARLPEVTRGRNRRLTTAAETLDRPAAPQFTAESLAAPTPADNRLQGDLHALWCELFGAKELPLDANFFDLGGHSLLLVRAHQLLQQRLGITLPIVSLLRHPTIRSLAQHLAAPEAAAPITVADTALARVRRLRQAQARQRLGPLPSAAAASRRAPL